MYNNLLIKTVALSRKTKTLIQVITDAVLILFAFFLSLTIRLNDYTVIGNANYWLVISYLLPVTLLIYTLCGFYQSVIRFISEKFYLTVGFGVVISSVIMYLSTQILEISMPRSIPIIYYNFLFIFTVGSRYFFKYIFLNLYYNLRNPVAIYGAGESGRKLLNSLNESLEYHPRIFIDDNKKLGNKKINGLNVFEFEKSIIKIKKLKIKLVLLALPNLSHSKRKQIIDRLDKHKLAVKLLSHNSNSVSDKEIIVDVNNLTINDILEREEIPIKTNLIKKNIFQKNILITGCGGSIGRELCIQVLDIGPKTLIYLDNSEFSLYKIDSQIRLHIEKKKINVHLFPVLGSIQDKFFLELIFDKFSIDTIFHTAAYKHVPLVETNVIEATKNNVFGTLILSRVAVLKKVKSFVLISSDKAVRPTNFMGATKRVTELICQCLYSSQKNTVFSIVRFGNVIGSSGSVIPLFARQIEKGGPVTLTHKKVTRYFMSVKEAVGLVIQAGAMSKNGELFLLDMGNPKNILNLAKKMIRLYGKIPIFDDNQNLEIKHDNYVRIKLTGLRPGEKIYEELLINNKSTKTKHPRIYKAKEKKVSKKNFSIFLNDLEKFCINGDLNKIKLSFESSPINLKTSNNFKI